MIAAGNVDVRFAQHFGKKTETAGTVINHFYPPRQGLYTRLLQLVYTNQGTAHTITFLRPIGETVLAAAAAASQAVLELAAQPATSRGGGANNVAANDYLAWENDDGTFAFGAVSSVSGLAITMAASLAKAAAAGRKVWFLGVAADVNVDGYAHPAAPAPASATTTYSDSVAGVASAIRPYDPLLVQSNNAVAAGTIERAAVAWTAR